MLIAIAYIVCAAAVILIVVTVALIIRHIRTLKQYKTCKATVVEVKREELPFGQNDRWRLVAIAEYMVNGWSYKRQIPFYSSKPKVGDVVELLYKDNDADSVRTKRGLVTAPVITGILAIVFSIVTVVMYAVLLARI